MATMFPRCGFNQWGSYIEKIFAVGVSLSMQRCSSLYETAVDRECRLVDGTEVCRAHPRLKHVQERWVVEPIGGRGRKVSSTGEMSRR